MEVYEMSDSHGGEYQAEADAGSTHLWNVGLLQRE
jgi:hypothetical protein